MSRANDHAFPIPANTNLPNGESDWGAPGLTIREFFAAMAMNGMLAAESGEYTCSVQRLAAGAVVRADALIAELAKEPT